MAAGTEIYLTQVSAETQKEHTMQLYQTRMQVRYLGDSRPAAFVAHMAGQTLKVPDWALSGCRKTKAWVQAAVLPVPS